MRPAAVVPPAHDWLMPRRGAVGKIAAVDRRWAVQVIVQRRDG